MNKNDAYDMLQSLGYYLETTVKTLKENNIVVTVNNTAPTEPKWPLIVFTRVNLMFKRGKYGNGVIMQRKTHLKRDTTNANGSWPSLGSLIGESEASGFASGNPLPDITSDDRKSGITLFPGQSVTYEMSLPVEDLKDFWVEGTISRQYLFHHAKELILSRG